MKREIRVSPDGMMVAIRSVYNENPDMAWGSFNAQTGGGWLSSQQVEGWTVIQEASE